MSYKHEAKYVKLQVFKIYHISILKQILRNSKELKDLGSKEKIRLTRHNSRFLVPCLSHSCIVRAKETICYGFLSVLASTPAQTI